MEYNRVAVTGHADLATHVGHLVEIGGTFETEGTFLQFVVEEVNHRAATCESQALALVHETDHL